MEIIPYLIGVVAFVLAIYWSAANATLEKGKPSFGLFRYSESAAGAAAAEKERKLRSRAFQRQSPPAQPGNAAAPVRPRASRPVPRR